MRSHIGPWINRVYVRMKTKEKMDDIPKVSIIVPNFNHAPYLCERLNSIFNQTYADFEVIILDDASTDESRTVIVPFLEQKFVSFYPNVKNSGIPCSQWSKGIDIARGEYVWLAESDDVAEPQFLERLVSILDNHPQVGIAYCQSMRIGSDGESLGTMRAWTDDLDTERWLGEYINEGVNECAKFLLFKNTIPNASAVLFRKSAYSEVGSDAMDYRLSGDWYVWACMLIQNDIAFVPEELNSFRIHPLTVRASTQMEKWQDEMLKVQKFIVKNVVVSRELKNKIVVEKWREFIYRCRRVSLWLRPVVALRLLPDYMAFFLLSPGGLCRAVIARHSN